jgi:predicted secreted hydrolase
VRCVKSSVARLLVAAGAAILIGGCEGPAAPATAGTGIRFLADGGAAAGFARASTPRSLSFPLDHGAHPRFHTEWWYFTGNVDAADGRHFGFELTFFRIALRPSPAQSRSAWTTNQAWMAHFAVSDVKTGRLIAAERLARGALGLAGATSAPFRVWVEDWSADGNLDARDGTVRLQAAGDGAAADLRLTALMPPMAHGQHGLDRKGAEPGNASYYYSIPRLDVAGTLRVGDGEPLPVQGSAWMDREWSSSGLDPDIAGWDWFGLQLTDGRDLMFYRLRDGAGAASPFSGGTLIVPGGGARHLSADDVTATPLRRWRSRATGVTYPVAWRLRSDDPELDLTVEPYFDDQELKLSVRYWEGAVRAAGTAQGKDVSGQGYLELAGY